MIQNVPSWAQGHVQSFRDSQTLPGGQRVDIPAGQAREVDGKISSQIEDGIRLDESEMDLAPGIGVIRADIFGTKTEVYYNGNSTQGEFVQTVADDMAAYGKFSPQGVDVVVAQKDGENIQGQAFHIDRQAPEKSFAVIQGGGFNLL
ncbi:hypothetical protein DYH09_15080 [bacterium CPR1]|nr:hypothetical protein [bacterium CPR1]